MRFSKMKTKKVLPPFFKNYQKLQELSDLNEVFNTYSFMN